MTSLQAGSCNLSHDAFKIMRDTNLMKFQQTQGEIFNNIKTEQLKNEMLKRKEAFDESIKEY